MRYPPYRGTAANRFWVCGATALLVIGSAGALAFQMDTDERRRFCGNDDTRCLEMDYYDVSSCFFIYSKRPAWFGLIDRWYVYSERGGPTLPLRKFKELVYVDWMDAVRFSAFRSNLLNEIGARELGNCDVDYFLRCTDRQEFDWSECQHRLVHRLAYWKSRRTSPEELRELGESRE